MSVVLDSTTQVLVQGITGREGSFWTEHMLDYGTNIVAGVTPGREGQEVHRVPVYHTVRRATAEHQADASLLFVPPRFAKDAIYETLDGGIKTVVVLCEGIPLHDALQRRPAGRSAGAAGRGGACERLLS